MVISITVGIFLNSNRHYFRDLFPLPTVKPTCFPARQAQARQKSQAIILLTQLLSESNEVADEYEKETGRAYSAGQTCERTYNSFTEVKN